MTQASQSAGDSADVWEAVQRLGLYGLTKTELDALIHQDRDSALRVDRVAAEAVHFVRGLRAGMAAGDAC